MAALLLDCYDRGERLDRPDSRPDAGDLAGGNVFRLARRQQRGGPEVDASALSFGENANVGDQFPS